MVTVKGFEKRKNAEGNAFYVVFLEGGIGFQKSQKTGQFYAVSRKTSITTTFDEQTCKSLVGSQMPGSIQRVECEPYQVVNKETGEVRDLNHRWTFVPEGESLEEAVFTEEIFNTNEL